MPWFHAPEWWILAAGLVFVAWYWRAPRAHEPLRFLALLLLVLALTEPYLPELGRGLDLFVLVDRSPSVRDRLEPRLEELEALLRRGRSASDRLFFVDFAEGVRRRGDSGAETVSGLGETTDLATALQFTLSSMDPDRSARLLLLGDGYSTTPLGAVSERLLRQEVPLDLRLIGRPGDSDWKVAAIRAPTRVKPHEPFQLEIRIEGRPDADVPYALRRNGEVQTRAVASVRSGSAVVRFSDRAGAGGGVRYDLELLAGDEVPGNDRATAWVEVAGGPRLVLVTAYQDAPLVRILERQGFEVELVRDPRRLGLGHLVGTRGVVLDNVPADRIPDAFLEALDHYVRVAGGGLLMTGGEYSFGSGGYFESPVDPLLPVAMELREDHRTLSVAMAIVMDRSGSMGIGVGGGKTKMDLANEGAARSVELLGPRDAVAVLAVDSTAHVIVPLTPLSGGAEPLVDKVRRVQSMGGGIYVYEGLRAAWDQIQRAPQGQRHVILFADAADSEVPGDYTGLIARMAKENTTLSVIGLGTENDPDADLLKDIARRGAGRIFFNADPATLPALFAQETVAVARSSFVEGRVGVEPTSGWLEVSSSLLEGLSTVDGYNLSYLRDEATAAAITTDEYEAPLVAFWNRGAGRVAAVSFPLGGEHSSRVRGWPGYGDFLQTLARWLMGDDVPPGIGVTTRLEGARLEVDLLFDESWQPRLSREPAAIWLARGSAGVPEELVWQRLESGRFRASSTLEPGDLYRGVVAVGPTRLPFGPIAAPSGVEWRFDRASIDELRALSRASGGVERTDLASVWKDRLAGAELDLRPYALVAFLCVFLLDAFVSRVGWRLPVMDRARPAAVALEKVAKAASERTHQEMAMETKPASGLPPASEARRRRFARAKRGR